MFKLAEEGSEMCFAVRKTFVEGRKEMAPKPQDACALQRRLTMGRPRVSNPRDMKLKLYFTATEYECLVRRAKAIGARPTHFGRMLVLDKEVVPEPHLRTPSYAEK